MSVSIHNLCLFLCTILISKSLVSFLFLLPHVKPLKFNYTSFDQPDALSNIICHNDSSLVNGGLQLSANRQDRTSQHSVGRASYAQPLHLWNNSTKETTNFTTHFSFQITQLGYNPQYYLYGDGITFFLTPFNDFTAFAPNASDGGFLGLVSGDDKSGNSTEYPFVAVEFDTFNNKKWDPEDFDGKYDHLGIDVNSIKSKVYAPWSGKGVENETTANVWITYDSSTQNLSVYLTYDVTPVFNGQSNLSCVIDLSSILPEKVRVGFSSTTGRNLEFHNLISWDFNSTSVDIDVSTPPSPLPSPESPPSKKNSTLVVGLVAGISILAAGMAFVGFMCWRKRSRKNTDNLNLVDDDFDQGTWPKRFSYNELSRATNNFPEEGKLGQGGFGGVYRGFLTDFNREVAVKKISRGSDQGTKEYVSEVKAISCLRHKNLVQLLGWCHDRGDLILVYDYMPNGSLDTHLHANKMEVILSWAMRYRIVQDLASALLYLHHGWEQCVLHRDIKSSNIMLDSNFNAKLGDFGLARLVDHNLGSQTTALAGTLGYLAPECVTTGRVTRETDVYSFGVVALEIASGRRPVESKEEPSKVNIVEWVWSLYLEGHLLEAADKRLEGEFNEQEIECLLMVGLWCCHPDHTYRPSIRQAINVLNLESPFPSLPMNSPVPVYSYPQMSMSMSIRYTKPSSGGTGSTGTTSSSSRSVTTGIAS